MGAGSLLGSALRISTYWGVKRVELGIRKSQSQCSQCNCIKVSSEPAQLWNGNSPSKLCPYKRIKSESSPYTHTHPGQLLNEDHPLAWSTTLDKAVFFNYIVIARGRGPESHEGDPSDIPHTHCNQLYIRWLNYSENNQLGAYEKMTSPQMTNTHLKRN